MHLGNTLYRIRWVRSGSLLGHDVKLVVQHVFVGNAGGNMYFVVLRKVSAVCSLLRDLLHPSLLLTGNFRRASCISNEGSKKSFFLMNTLLQVSWQKCFGCFLFPRQLFSAHLYPTVSSVTVNGVRMEVYVWGRLTEVVAIVKVSPNSDYCPLLPALR